jgi:hypothetical protein
MLETKDSPPDPVVQGRVASHQAILKELDGTRLFAVANWDPTTGRTIRQAVNRYDDTRNGDATTNAGHADAAAAAATLMFSTKNNRLGQSTGTAALCSMLCMGLRCQVTLLSAGAVRAGKDHQADKHFIWSDLKAEMPFSTRMSVCLIPGKALQETIQHSRQHAKQGIAKGGYLHTSKTTTISNEKDNSIESILGEPFDPDREHLTAFPIAFLGGIDNHKPLLEWAKRKKPHELPNKELAVPAKLVLVEHFSALLWLRFGTFEEMAGDDDVICKNDVTERTKQMCGGNEEEVAHLSTSESVFSVADLDNSGTISALEQMIVHFVAL